MSAHDHVCVTWLLHAPSAGRSQICINPLNSIILQLLTETDVISKKHILVFLFLLLPTCILQTDWVCTDWLSPFLSVVYNLWAKWELTVTSASLQFSFKHPVFNWGHCRVSLLPWNFLKCILVHLGHTVRDKMVEQWQAWQFLFYTITWNNFMLYEKL